MSSKTTQRRLTYGSNNETESLLVLSTLLYIGLAQTYMATVCHTSDEEWRNWRQYIINSNADCWELVKDKVKNQKENWLEETRRHNQRTKTKMVVTCHTNGGLQNTSLGYTVGVERIQEEARTTKDKLDGHRETQSEKHEHHLGRSQGTSGWQDRMASTGRGMNRAEQNRATK